MPTVKSNPAPAGTAVPEATATKAGTPAATEVVVTNSYALEYNDKGCPLPPKEDITYSCGGIEMTASTTDLAFVGALMALEATPVEVASRFALWAQYRAKLSVWQAENTGRAILEAHPAFAEYKAAVLIAETKLAKATEDLPEVQAMQGAEQAVDKLRASITQARTMRGDSEFATFIIPKRNRATK